MRIKRFKKRSQKGLTIVELLVSITVFSLVVSFGVAVFVRSLRAQRSVVSLIAASDNMSIAIEAISREVRRGRDFSVGALNRELRFVNAEQKEVVYRFDALANDGGGAITRSESGSGFHPVTAPTVRILQARFIVQTQLAGRPILPRVSMAFELGASDRDSRAVTANIHTSVSSRGLNNPLPSGN